MFCLYLKMPSGKIWYFCRIMGMQGGLVDDPKKAATFPTEQAATDYLRKIRDIQTDEQMKTFAGNLRIGALHAH